MRDALILSLDEARPAEVRYGGGARGGIPTYPIVLALALIVGATSLIAWHFGDLSLERRAGRGEARAQYLLGKRVFDHALVAGDYQRAAALIRAAADQGYDRAQAGLGVLYEHGLGVPRNYAEALNCLRRAADQGCAVAQNELGVMYAKGRGVPRSLGEASRWCRMAAAQGSEIAKRNLTATELASAKMIAELTTPAKRTYRSARVQRIEADGVTISYRPPGGGLGMAKLKLDNLPAELRQVCEWAGKEGVIADAGYSRMGLVATTL